MTATIRRLWRNDYSQTIIIIGLIMAVVFGFWYGSQLVLNTEIPPMLAVESGSMCIPYDSQCDGWSHPFDHTLHIGDLVIIQGVNPKDLNINYPNSDIIVFHKPGNPSTLIVHRIAAKIVGTDGTLYFYTKGDGNPPVKWPATLASYDSWGPVSEHDIVGKVIMRIPWIGHISLTMHHLTENYSVVPIIVTLIIMLIIIELVGPVIRQKRAQAKSHLQTSKCRCLNLIFSQPQRLSGKY
jgi:signal peptidase I